MRPLSGPTDETPPPIRETLHTGKRQSLAGTQAHEGSTEMNDDGAILLIALALFAAIVFNLWGFYAL